MAGPPPYPFVAIAPPFPVLRLRGLPFSAAEHEVRVFLVRGRANLLFSGALVLAPLGGGWRPLGRAPPLHPICERVRLP